MSVADPGKPATGRASLKGGGVLTPIQKQVQEWTGNSVLMAHESTRVAIHEVDPVVGVQHQEATHNHCLLQVGGLCSDFETVPWICSCSVCLYMAEWGTDFGKTPMKPLSLGEYKFGGGINFGGL